jgi:glucan phosphoethanolaminetransferase (alkaline phosphatase superfamily)
MVVSLLTNLAVFTVGGEIVNFEAMGFYLNEEIIFSTWGLFIIGNISAVLSVLIVFIYKKRMLQIRLAGMNLFIILGYYGLIAFYFLKRNTEVVSTFENVGIGMITPFVAIVFTYLAIRKIGADEALIRSLNRIR